MANYAVVLPESKLTFRGTDALRLDAVTVLSLSVLFVQVSGVRESGEGRGGGEWEEGPEDSILGQGGLVVGHATPPLRAWRVPDVCLACAWRMCVCMACAQLGPTVPVCSAAPRDLHV